MSSLTGKVMNQVRAIGGGIDLLVGVPAYSCAHTIAYVLYNVAEGLSDYFPDASKAIFVSDGGSNDGTLQVAKAIKLSGNVHRILGRYKGVPGKGSAVKAIMEAAVELDAEAVALVDSDLRSIKPEWMKLLLEPILKGGGLVTPFYVRDKYDGNITNHICYPITYGVYGMDVRQPIGGDFGLSKRLIKTLLESQPWDRNYVSRFGIDIFITHSAISLGYKVEQAELGSKLHEAKDPALHLKPMFIQVLGSMFRCMKEYQGYWRKIRAVSSPALHRIDLSFPIPEPIKVAPENQKRIMEKTMKERAELLKSCIPSKLIENLKRFKLDDETWAKILYHIASNFAKSEDIDLLELLYGLWLGKVAYYVDESRNSSIEEAESLIRREAEAFKEHKPYLADIYPKTG